MNKGILRDFSIPFLVLLVLTVFFRLTDADLQWAALFRSEQGWFLENLWIVVFLHRFGSIPALLVSFAAVCILGYSFISKKYVKYRKIALLCVLLLSIGSGLIVNVILKDHWGRPRPNQVDVLGGEKRFLPVWEKGDCETCRSFPCGDASAGFFFLFPFFVLRRKAPRLAASLLAVGIGYGALMGVARMARGAHFASDVIWSWGVMYVTGLALYYSLRMYKSIWWGEEREPSYPAHPKTAVAEPYGGFRVPGEPGEGFAMADQAYSVDSRDESDLRLEAGKRRRGSP